MLADLLRVLIVAGAIWLTAITLWLLVKPDAAERVHWGVRLSYVVLMGAIAFRRVVDMGTPVDFWTYVSALAVVLGLIGFVASYRLKPGWLRWPTRSKYRTVR